MSEELKKYLKKKGFEATTYLPYYDEKILNLIEDKVLKKVRRTFHNEFRKQRNRKPDPFSKFVGLAKERILELIEKLEKELEGLN